MAIRVKPNTADAATRVGYEKICGIPSDLMIYEPTTTGRAVGAPKLLIADPTIKGGHVARELPGNVEVGGSFAGVPNAHGTSPFVARALLGASATEELEAPSGVYQTTYAPSLADALVPGSEVPTYSVEADRGDDVPLLLVACNTVDFTLTVTDAAPTVVGANITGLWATIFEDAVATHPNPATEAMSLRGMPHQWLYRDGVTLGGGDLAAGIYIRLVDSYTDADGVDKLVFMARAGRPGPISGTWTVTIGTNVYAGAGGNAEKELVARNVAKDIDGDTIVVLGETHQVDTVTGPDSFTTVAVHVAGAAGEPVIAEYGSETGSVVFFEIEARENPQLGGPKWGNLRASSNGLLGQPEKGSRHQTYMIANTGIVPGASNPLTNPVTVTASSTTVSVPGGGVLAEVIQGGLFSTPGDPVGKRVSGVTSDIAFEVDFQYAASELAVAGTFKAPPLVSIGTVTATISTRTLTGTGFLTSLSIGAWTRTAGGQVRRVVSFNDTTATVDQDYTATEAAIDGFTDYEFAFLRPRPTWASTEHISGVFLEQLARLEMVDETGERFPLEGVQSFVINHVSGIVPSPSTGNEYHSNAKPSQSSGVATVVLTKSDTRVRAWVESRGLLRLEALLTTAKRINGTDYYYSWFLVTHFTPNTPSTDVPDGTANLETLTGTTSNDANDPQFPDALTVIMTGDDLNPLNL